MLTRRRLVAVAGAAAVVAAALVGSPGPAAADVTDPVACSQHPASCTVTASAPGSPAWPANPGSTSCTDPGGREVACFLPGKGWYGGDGCWYRLATGAELALVLSLGSPPAAPAAWYVGTCGDPASNFWPVTKLRLFAEPAGVARLALQAVRNLRLPNPAIQVSPAPPAAQVLGVPTWLWVGSGSWGSRSATASAGGVSVTATATASTVVWSTGDGATVRCVGPGTAWTPGTDPATASPTCGHTYTAVPAGGTARLSATITWQVSWAGGGASGVVAGLTTTAALDLPVTQVGAVNTIGAR